MKQSKRMLSVLLAIIMICSTFTIGAQAMKVDITSPANGYDEVLNPVVSADQAARMVLDEIDVLLVDIEEIDLKVMTIKIDSIDHILDSLVQLDDSVLADIALGILGGDLKNLNLSAGKVKDSQGNNCRRSCATSTDFEVLGAVLTVLQKNADIVCKIAYDGISFGLLDSLGVFGQDDLAALRDIHGLVTNLVQSLLAGEDFEIEIDQEYHTNTSIDAVLQDFIDHKLVKLIMDLFAEDGENMGAELMGLGAYVGPDGTLTQEIDTTVLLPSLTEGNLGRLSIADLSFYDFLVNLVKALVRDIVIPRGDEIIGELVDIDEIADYIDIALPILELNATFPEDATGQQKIKILLESLLIGADKNRFFQFNESESPNGVAVKYLTFSEGFWPFFIQILRTVLPMLPPLLGDDCPNFDKTDAELSELDPQEFTTYILQRVLEKFVDGVQFADDCHTIRELASRTLIEVCKDLMPQMNFEEMFDAGQRTYDSDDCLYLAAYVIRYYLNGETTIQDNTPDASMDLTSMLNTAADWALNNYGAVVGYDPSKYATANVWQKVYGTVFALLPLTIFVGSQPVSVGNKQVYKAGAQDSWTGLQNIIMDDIIGGVLEFNIEDGDPNEVGVSGLNKILSLIGRRSDSCLNDTLPAFVIKLVARLINPLFGLPSEKDATNQAELIIPYTYTSFQQLLTADSSSNRTSTPNLTNTVYRLCTNIGFINKGANSLFYKACPLIAQIMGLWGDEDEKYNYSYISPTVPADFNGGRQYSYDTLKALYDQYDDSKNDVLEYDDPGYIFFHMVDFQPFLYLDFKSARSDVGSLVAAYEAGTADMATFRTDATLAAYKLLSIVDLMNNSYNRPHKSGSSMVTTTEYGETTACDNQLAKVIAKANSGGYTQTENPDGSKTYTDRSWSMYTRAKAFADAVEAEYQAAANAGDDSADLLRDMRQSKINTARKMLVDAMAALKSWVPLADYTMLDSSLEMAGYNTSLRMYSKKAVQKALDAYMEALNIARDYDMDDQFIVDNIQATLDEALENFNYDQIDYLQLWMDGYGQYIDEDNSYLFGLEEGFANQQSIDEMYGSMFDNYMMNYGMATSPIGDPLVTDIASTPAGNGTGAVIKMYGYDEYGEIDYTRPKQAKYTVIIFGDVDGDAYSNAMDSTVLRAYCQLKLTDAQIGAPALYAADANESGTIDTKDAKFYESVGLQKSFTNQTPESLIYKTYGILDVLGLRETV